ncbi:HAD-IA family hydrolase [Endozoicomonas sp. SM1973]|uniref:HAD-IA family hydrolase n=1 Tax=Spartinivicinus marinus TaxID=2994442 RepID=A0A853I4C2_9GAMM|nr:HAD-IA family hydrolase [Spartinivicinus marinus]MCX4029430.1 HAD-IA family hydrolase [Spartinivicinus marinus]NYZ65004.1 HAD-IA family hydrolase [Spartinivicinus marinus]
MEISLFQGDLPANAKAKHYSLIVFDWDGTLVNSISRIVHSLKAAAEASQLPILTEEAYEDVIGLGMPEATMKLYPEHANSHEQFRNQYRESYLIAEAKPAPLYSGVEQGLILLKQAGYRLAVATGKSRRGLNRMLNQRAWHDLFEVTRCADETRSKPDPLMLTEILDETQLTAEQVLMVGDSEYDVAMAAAINIDRVAVTYGVHAKQRLLDHSPIKCVDQFQELVNWLVDIK